MGKTHRFQVGEITCIAIEEGTTSYPIANLLQRHPNATSDEVDSISSELDYEGEDLVNSFNTLYIESNGTKILFDVGMGVNPERPAIGGTIHGLEAEGIKPEDIDIVYITHFHGDHYLGLLSDGAPTFPNARYVTLDDEWNFWLSDEAKEKLGDRVQGILKVVKPLEDKFSTLSAGEELASGVTVEAIPGHTMGQSAIRVESGGESLVHLVDLLHNSAQFRFPDWHFTYDTDADLAVKSRREQLSKASEEHTLLMFYHLRFPGLGHVQRDGDSYKWLPQAD